MRIENFSNHNQCTCVRARNKRGNIGQGGVQLRDLCQYCVSLMNLLTVGVGGNA
jgi:hypothetical protein